MTSFVNNKYWKLVIIIDNSLIISNKTTSALLGSCDPRDLDALETFVKSHDRPGEFAVLPSGRIVFRGIQNEMQVENPVNPSNKRFCLISYSGNKAIAARNVTQDDILALPNEVTLSAQVFCENSLVGHLLQITDHILLGRTN